MMLLVCSVMDVYAEDGQFEAQAITWIQLFENKERLLTHKISLTAFYVGDGFYQDQITANIVASEYLVFPFLGEYSEGFIKHCLYKDLKVVGVISADKNSRAPRVRKVIKLSTISNPEYNCLEQISNFVN
jgi:hypothetical protein